MILRGKLGRYLRAALGASDFVVLNAACALAQWLAGLHATTEFWVEWNVAFLPIAIIVSATHARRIVYADRIAALAIAAGAAQIVICGALLYFRDAAPGLRTLLLASGGVLCVMLAFWWIASRHILRQMRRHGINYRAAILVGDTQAVGTVESQLRDDPGYGYRILARIPAEAAREEIPALLARHKVNDIFYAAEAADATSMQFLMRSAAERGATFTYVPPLNPLAGVQFRHSAVGTMPAFVHAASPLSSAANRAIKRAMDVAVALPVVVLLPALSAVVGAAVKLSSPGPVFFRQLRTGLYGVEFTCYKFRTMRLNAQSDSLAASPGDNRVTRVGAWLRRTSIDELPQFYNVLRGDMSVVGPRPHMLSETKQYRELIERFMLRHSVKPGITGWAQIRGLRGGTLDTDKMRRRVEHDVWYIAHWTPLLDIKILWITFVNIFRGDKNAY